MKHLPMAHLKFSTASFGVGMVWSPRFSVSRPADSLKAGHRTGLFKHSLGLLLAVSLALLAGCAAGPNYKAPKVAVPAAFAGGAETNLSTNETAVTWWRGFNDPVLDALEARALAQNLDLAQAVARVKQANRLREFAASARAAPAKPIRFAAGGRRHGKLQ